MASILYTKFGMLAIMALIVLATSHGVTGMQSTCNVDGTVNEGDPVNLTCHFDNDISKLQRDVTISRSIPGKGKEVLLRCAWFSSGPRIFTFHGATLVGNISNTLTLMIAQAKINEIYECLVANSDKTTPCTLNISGIPNDNRMSENRNIDLPIGLSVLGVVLLAVLIVLLVFVYTRKKHQQNKAQYVCKKVPGERTMEPVVE